MQDKWCKLTELYFAVFVCAINKMFPCSLILLALMLTNGMQYLCARCLASYHVWFWLHVQTADIRLGRIKCVNCQMSAQLLQRDRATYYVSWNLLNCFTNVVKIPFEKALPKVKHLEGHSKWSELLLNHKW